MAFTVEQTTQRSWKDDGLIILVLVFCLVMVGIQLLLKDDSGAAGNVATDPSGLRFESLVRGCNSDSEKISRGISLNVAEKQASLEVNQTAVVYRRTVSHACCLTVELTHEQSQRAIVIKEKWSGSPCRCLCTTQTQAVLSNIPAGEYALTVIEQSPTNEQKPLLTQSVAIPE
ncbi:MAG: hypothetical protein WC497_00100 [Patescibacteria group bacterium]